VKWLCFAAALLFAGAAAAAPAPLPGGKSRFEFTDKKGDPSRPVTVWMFVPEGCGVECPLQFVMHGVKRNGEDYLDNWVEFAKERKFIVIAPEFARAYFPKDDDYSLGRSTTESDPAKWAFAVPEHLFEWLKSNHGLTASSYRMFGHSAGGQFVHRLQLFYPEHHADPIIAANPGWYTLLQWGLDDAGPYKFPYNTIDSKVDEARAKKSLSRPFVLLLGSKDTDPNDENLNRSAGANEQGKFRLARGENFMQNARAAAEKLGVTPVWQSRIVEGVAHDNAGMAKAAVQLMYGGTAKPATKNEREVSTK
jgi:poly(3-hydroxybutyrate) depolymerase